MSHLAFVHTVSSLAPTFDGLVRELDPGIEIRHVVDETLLADAIRAGSVPAEVEGRLERHVDGALGDGAGLVVVTCSSMGAATEAIAARRGWPLTRIDAAMADRAIELGSRIGVLATLRTTLVPTSDLIRRVGRGRSVEVVEQLADGAFAALKGGDRERHDALVRDAIRAVLGSVDVIVLAQASMARVAETLGTEAEGTPILASPRLGVARAVARFHSITS